MTDHHAHVPRFGYRGRALTLLGVVWILIGVLLVGIAPGDPDTLLDYIPGWARVAMWVVSGTVALVTAWWPPGSDRFGFMALTIPATARALSFTFSTLLGLLPGRALGDTGYWPLALAWSVIVGFVFLISAWPEPAHFDDGSES